MSVMKQRTIYMGERVPASIVLDEGRLEVRRVNVELLSLNDSDSDSGEDHVQVNGTRKRRRLTNLSPEEKMLRRKLKNRMAAQTARDRKKQKMVDLEELLVAMQEENQKLLAENKSLRNRTSNLTMENEMLKERLQAPQESDDNVIIVKTESSVEEEVVEMLETSPGACAVSTERLSEPFESAELKPQQKEAARIIITLLTTFYLYRIMAAISLHWMGSVKAVSSNVLKVKQDQTSGVCQLPPPSEPCLPPWWGSHQKNWNPSMN